MSRSPPTWTCWRECSRETLREPFRASGPAEPHAEGARMRSAGSSFDDNWMSSLVELYRAVELRKRASELVRDLQPVAASATKTIARSRALRARLGIPLIVA